MLRADTREVVTGPWKLGYRSGNKLCDSDHCHIEEPHYVHNPYPPSSLAFQEFRAGRAIAFQVKAQF